MRTAAEFDLLYSSPDPWKIARLGRRDRALRRVLAPHVAGKTVLELGCGEGHLTAAVFGDASWITGVDISYAAISRAPKLSNATFAVMDFMSDTVSLGAHEVVAALECLYYLAPGEREAFFRKLARQHRGIFIMSAPIIGGRYFTHEALLDAFRRHGLRLHAWRNMNAYWNAGLGGTLARVAERLPFGDKLLALCPERFIYQRCYVLQV